jgi:hypothetical protein
LGKSHPLKTNKKPRGNSNGAAGQAQGGPLSPPDPAVTTAIGRSPTTLPALVSYIIYQTDRCSEEGGEKNVELLNRNRSRLKISHFAVTTKFKPELQLLNLLGNPER